MSWEAIFDSEETRETKEFAPIKPGEYMAFVEEAKIMETKDPVEVSIRWRIVQNGEFKNRVVFENYKITKERQWVLKRDLELLGITCKADQLPNELQTLVGKEAVLSISTRQFKEKTYFNHTPKDAKVTLGSAKKDFASLPNMAPKAAKFDKDEVVPF